VHGNARLTPRGRLTLVLRIASGPPVAHVAAEMGISRPTAYKWWHSFRTEGAAGLVDRSSRPHTCPHRTPPAIEARVIELRQATKLGPARYQLRPQGPGAPEHSPQKIHRVCRLIARRRPARVNLFEAGFFGNHCVVGVSSMGSLIQTTVGSAGGWGGLWTKRSGWVA
jgi:transposase-like protein